VGLLTDFFLASSEELSLLDLKHGPGGTLPTVQAKGFDPVELLSLEARMTGASEPAVSQPLVREQPDAMVVALGAAFRDALAAIDEAAMERFGEEWLLSADEARILSEVADLARRGRRGGKGLYVWLAL
jgi:hypothetical protein